MADFGKLNFSVSFNPTSAFPLDARSYFETLAEAQAAAATADVAGSSTTTYFYGQTIVVVENNVATMYVIQPDKTLAETGGKIEINENAFLLDASGKLDLYGFADAVAGAQLTKGADGKISWIKPDSTTVEGLSASIESLRSDVDALAPRVTDVEEAINVLNGTGEGSIDKKVTSKISEVVGGASADFDTLKEMEDWISSHGSDATKMNTQINANTEAINKINTELDNKVNANETIIMNGGSASI